MAVFDYVVLGIVALSLVLGLWRGVVSEMMALAAWVLAFMAALEFGEQSGQLAFGGIAMVIWVVPPEPREHQNQPRGRLADVLRHAGLLRLNFGVFVLHAVQLAMWMAVPALLERAGLAKAHHWWIYLPAVLASFVVMGGTLFPAERRGHLRAVFLSAIGLVAAVAGVKIPIIFIAGFFLDWISIVLIFVPLFTPLVIQAGFNPVTLAALIESNGA